MKEYTREVEITHVDTKSKKNRVTVTYVDGTKETFRVNDKKFLETNFKLVPDKRDMN